MGRSFLILTARESVFVPPDVTSQIHSQADLQDSHSCKCDCPLRVCEGMEAWVFNPFAVTSHSHKAPGPKCTTGRASSSTGSLNTLSTPSPHLHDKSSLHLTLPQARASHTLPLLDKNQDHIRVSRSPVSVPTPESLSPEKVPTMPNSEAWGSRWEEEVDLALEPAGAATGITGLGQPSAQA